MLVARITAWGQEYMHHQCMIVGPVTKKIDNRTKMVINCELRPCKGYNQVLKNLSYSRVDIPGYKRIRAMSSPLIDKLIYKSKVSCCAGHNTGCLQYCEDKNLFCMRYLWSLTIPFFGHDEGINTLESSSIQRSLLRAQQHDIINTMHLGKRGMAIWTGNSDGYRKRNKTYSQDWQ